MAQVKLFEVSVYVTDSNRNAIEAVNVELNEDSRYITNKKGLVRFSVAKGVETIRISHLSFDSQCLKGYFYCDTILHLVLIPKPFMMDDVLILSTRYKNESIKVTSSNNEIIRENEGNTLMAKLDKIAGVASINIGQGFAKPSIRGLSANRVVVTENGIKQQGQQWGMDHGLEIDHYGVENIAIIKGSSSLEYGSDAIGGVIAISPMLRDKDTLETSVAFNANSSNSLFGTSIASFYQKNNSFIKGRLSYQDYGDYRVPAKSFDYLGYTMPIYGGKLKNTAGRDDGILLSAGLKKRKIESTISMSNVYGKMGFFSGAHGIPGKGSLEPDGRSRNIDLPYQSVNHLKIIGNNKINANRGNFFYIDLAYQSNLRQEYATAHQHGSQPIPTNPLELDLHLKTITAALKWKKQLMEAVSLSIGLNTEFQDNKIGGYSFLLPRFNQQSLGAFVVSRYTINKQINITSGMRYDYGKLQIAEHIDNYLLEGFERAAGINRSFDNFSFSIGTSYNPINALGLKLNLAKSFRMPTANELSSNGVHHGTFRYEIGDPTLASETAYQADISADISSKYISLSLSGFVTYFNNYIYLNPTGEYSIPLSDGESLLLPDVGQVYRYTGGRSRRWGGESEISLFLTPWFKTKSTIEYVYAADVEHDYPIPFTPPLGIINSLEFKWDRMGKLFSTNRFNLSYRYTASQKRVRNEYITPSSSLFDFMLKSNVSLSKKTNMEMIISCNNIFNTKYYNHISFYRSLGLPEAGRNFTLSLFFLF